MLHRYRKLVSRLRRHAPVRFGTFRRLARTAAPADWFGRWGDGRTVLIADGPDDVDRTEIRDRLRLQALRRRGFADVTDATAEIIAEIDKLIDDLMDELGIPDVDDDTEEAAAVARLDAELGVHEPTTGPHTHSHSHGDGTTHSHGHFHNDSNVHNHSHADASYAGLGEDARRAVDADREITDPAELDALVASLLAAYPDDDRAALTAAVDPTSGEIIPRGWHAYLCAEGIRTDDGREIALGACRAPDLPVSMRLLVEDEGGHWGAVTCGRIDTMERQDNRPQDGINRWYATGVFGSDPNGQLAELMVGERTQRFVSIDPRDVTMEWIEVEVTRERFDVIYIDDDDDEGGISDCWMRFTDLVIGAATIVPMPAIQLAVIELDDVDLPEQPIATASAPSSMIAAGAPVAPPADWFENPGFHHADQRLVIQEDGRSLACPFTITDDGQVFGHIAWWGAKHTGFQGREVHPPRSRSGYAYYLTGPGVECADGSFVEGVGQVTMGTGHAGTNLDWKATVAHYDGGYGAVQVADVRAGEDDFGIWIAGALRPGLTAEQVREARALSPSGDWRDISRNLELVATLLVPVPGFPVRRSLAASGVTYLDEFAAVRMGIDGDEKILSLVAAGRVRRIDPEARLAALERRLAALSAQVRPLLLADVDGLLDGS